MRGICLVFQTGAGGRNAFFQMPSICSVFQTALAGARPFQMRVITRISTGGGDLLFIDIPRYGLCSYASWETAESDLQENRRLAVPPSSYAPQRTPNRD